MKQVQYDYIGRAEQSGGAEAWRCEVFRQPGLVHLCWDAAPEHRLDLSVPVGAVVIAGPESSAWTCVLGLP